MIKEEPDAIVVITVYTFYFQETAMKISYDPETGALYVRLLEGQHERRNIRLNDEVP